MPKESELKIIERESMRSLDYVYLHQLCSLFSICYLVPTLALKIVQQLHGKKTLVNALP